MEGVLSEFFWEQRLRSPNSHMAVLLRHYNYTHYVFSTYSTAIWIPQDVKNVRNGKRCFKYGGHILHHWWHPTQNQVNKWLIVSTNLILIIEFKNNSYANIYIIHSQIHISINCTLSLDIMDKHDSSDCSWDFIFIWLPSNIYPGHN